MQLEHFLFESNNRCYYSTVPYLTMMKTVSNCSFVPQFHHRTKADILWLSYLDSSSYNNVEILTLQLEVILNRY